MSAPSTATPPLLLTKRLNAFLHAHQSTQLPTLLLTTAHGKLLAHASAHAVSVLRTHATVAASLLAIHTSSSVAIPTALPGSRTPEPLSCSPVTTTRRDNDNDDNDNDDNDDNDDDDHRRRHDDDADGGYGHEHGAAASHAIKPVTITVQLSGGTVIIRHLKCGLLFVCVGPAAHHLADVQLHHHQQHHENSGDGVGSPSEVESLISAGSVESATAAPVVAMRRHAAELAKWLDDKLGTLKVPEEGIGVVE